MHVIRRQGRASLCAFWPIYSVARRLIRPVHSRRFAFLGQVAELVEVAADDFPGADGDAVFVDGSAHLFGGFAGRIVEGHSAFTGPSFARTPADDLLRAADIAFTGAQGSDIIGSACRSIFASRGRRPITPRTTAGHRFG